LAATPEAAPDPFFEEDWDYTDTADFASNPNGWFTVAGAGQNSTNTAVCLDTIAPDGFAVQKSLRLAMEDTGGVCTHTTILCEIDFTLNQRDVWIETYVRFSDNFKTEWTTEIDNGCGVNDDIKLLMFDDAVSAGRWRLEAGSGGYTGKWGAAGSSNPNPTHEGWPAVAALGWNRWRWHLRGSTDGSTADGFYRFQDHGGMIHGPTANTSGEDIIAYNGDGWRGIQLGGNQGRGLSTLRHWLIPHGYYASRSGIMQSARAQGRVPACGATPIPDPVDPIFASRKDG